MRSMHLLSSSRVSRSLLLSTTIIARPRSLARPAIFAGTVLNQTGQAVEVIVITMAVYLTISLVTSALMNLYNRRMALVER